MITIIAVGEQNQQIKMKVKAVAITDVENFVCVDEEAAELLATTLQENRFEDLAEKLKKLSFLPEGET